MTADQIANFKAGDKVTVNGLNGIVESVGNDDKSIYHSPYIRVTPLNKSWYGVVDINNHGQYGSLKFENVEVKLKA